MRWAIDPGVRENSFDYFEKTLLTENGFREYDARWLVDREINPNGFVVLGRAYATMMREVIKEERVVVGHDFRSYSQDLCRSLVVGLLSAGVHVIDVGLCLTPMMYFAQHHFQCRAGLQVTASHNENGWTGVKIADGLSSTLGPEGIVAFKKIVYAGRFSTGCGGYEAYEGLAELYRRDILAGGALKRPAKVVVAAGNGTAGRFVPDILRALGCEVVEVDCDPDWTFRKYNPNPEDLGFLKRISEATRENGADLGLGFDGDGDRIGVVDDRGREVFADRLGLLVARSICRRHPGRSLVIDVKSTGLFLDDPILRQTGTRVHMWKTGHSYIKAKVAKEGALAGFEKSGHWFFNPPLGRGYDDGVVSAANLLRVVDEAGRPLSAMLDELPRTWQSPTLGPRCGDGDKYAVVDSMLRRYREDMESGATIGGCRIKDLIDVNGVRFVLEDDSWGLIRASSNKPSLVVVAEARSSEDQLYEIVAQIQKRLAETGKVGPYDQEMPPRG